MEQPDPDVVDAVLSLTLAVAAGDDEAAEVLWRSHDPVDLSSPPSRHLRMAAASAMSAEALSAAMLHVSPSARNPTPPTTAVYLIRR